jgi:phosphate transport system substrate-binding protein
LSFTRKDLFLALAARAIVKSEIVPNPLTKWSEVNGDFPATEIKVIGPPGSSGTRDSFESFVMRSGCEQLADIDAVDEEDRDAFCSSIRGEPYYVEGGEDDMIIVQRLAKEPSAFGIFGFSFAALNPEMVKANPVDGVQPTAATIADGIYPLARPLYIYVKNNRVAEVPMLGQLLSEYVSQAAIGPDGYLVGHGLVPLSEAERAESADKAKAFVGG